MNIGNCWKKIVENKDNWRTIKEKNRAKREIYTCNTVLIIAKVFVLNRECENDKPEQWRSSRRLEKNNLKRSTKKTKKNIFKKTFSWV